jgi:hypothetical protein
VKGPKQVAYRQLQLSLHGPLLSAMCTCSCSQTSHQRMIRTCQARSSSLLLLAVAAAAWFCPSRWSEQHWLQGWAVMAQRYANVAAVVGVGLRNEPRPTFVSESLNVVRPESI